MLLELWLASKLMFSRKFFFTSGHFFAFFGLILGVGTLVAAMGIVSGFETTLKNAMADVTGHVQMIARKNSELLSPSDIENQIKKVDSRMVSSAAFAFVEGVLPRNGKIRGVLIEGVQEERVHQVLHLKSRLVSGDILFSSENNGTLLGVGLAKEFNLKVGDKFKLVVPVANVDDINQFKRNVETFYVNGIVDLGKHEWNDRFIITSLRSAQRIAQLGDHYSGLMIRLQDDEQAQNFSAKLSLSFGTRYWVRDWRELNQNLFDAVKIERVIIFFVVCIIVLVAAVNVASALFVSILKKYSDIAILKSIGMRPKSIIRILSFQGIIIGFIGLLGGISLGFIFCYLFDLMQLKWNLIDGTVYKIDGIKIDIRWIDLFSVTAATMSICFLATLWPAYKGSRLNPVEGLRYE